MGDVEDTFTKQEIQAGYVTSGRDVLARQQQIVQQALSASSAGGVAPRKRVGGLEREEPRPGESDRQP